MKYRWQIIVFILASILLNALSHANGNTRYPLASKSTSTITTDNASSQANIRQTSYFQRALSYATHPESEPPKYVRNLSKTGINAFKDITWLNVGLDYRVRYEYRRNDLRRPQIATDNPIFLRSRLCLGITEILDPLRLVAEFEDARRYNGDFPRNRLDTNEYELI